MKALAALAALSLAVPLSAQRYELKRVDSITISRDKNFAFYWPRYPHVIAGNYPNSTYKRLEGAWKFDLTRIPDNAKITSMYLVTHHGSLPQGRPTIQLYWSDDDAWTRKTAKGNSCPPKTLLASTGEIPRKWGTLIFPIDTRRHDFSVDLKDNYLTLMVTCTKFLPKKDCGVVLDEGNPTLVICTSPGHLYPFGTGGMDSTKARHRLSATGCTARGGKLSVRAECGLDIKNPIVLFLGVSRTTWGRIPLPLDLTPFGAPGNHIYSALEAGPFSIPNGGGGGTLVLPIPAALPPGRVYMQSLLFDPKANSLGAVWSNGLDVEIG